MPFASPRASAAVAPVAASRPPLSLPALASSSLGPSQLRGRCSSALLRCCGFLALAVALPCSFPRVRCPGLGGDGGRRGGVGAPGASSRASGAGVGDPRGDCGSERRPDSCFARHSERLLGNRECPRLGESRGSEASSEEVERAPKPTPGLSGRAPARGQEMGGERFKLAQSSLLVLHRGDITEWFVDGETDAIVNAANKAMLGGGGVDGAIHRAAGPELYEACLELPQKAKNVRCRTGEAVITKGFRLPVSRIIHTVGPIYKDEISSASLLEKAYKSSLALAIENNIKYIAFPAISCGVYGYPYDEGANVALRTVRENANGLYEVHFVLFDKGTWAEWLSKANECFEKI